MRRYDHQAELRALSGKLREMEQKWEVAIISIITIITNIIVITIIIIIIIITNIRPPEVSLSSSSLLFALLRFCKRHF